MFQVASLSGNYTYIQYTFNVSEVESTVPTHTQLDYRFLPCQSSNKIFLSLLQYPAEKTCAWPATPRREQMIIGIKSRAVYIGLGCLVQPQGVLEIMNESDPMLPNKSVTVGCSSLRAGIAIGHNQDLIGKLTWLHNCIHSCGHESVYNAGL